MRKQLRENGMLRKKKDREAVKEFCELARRSLGKTIKAIKLFGSKANDMDTPGSDIDLFIVVSEKTPEVDEVILNIAFELDLKYYVYISVRVAAQSILKNPLWKNTPLLRNIQREGVLV